MESVIKELMHFFLLVVFSSTCLFAQSFYGILRGRILDPNGAAATAVVATLIDQTTSVTRSIISNQQGEYNFAYIQPSLYTVSV